jgi:predicted tellurium resistance membrane protein TerC
MEIKKAMEFFAAENLLNLFTLTGLEIVLGIDNVIFIALLVQHLEGKTRVRARIFGLSLAFVARIAMLFGASWIMRLTEPLFSVFSFPFSGRSLLLIAGGLFLVVKSILEVMELFQGAEHKNYTKSAKRSYFHIISQIIFIDIILSFDSIITAVGLSDNLMVIIIAIVIAMIVMLVSAEPIGRILTTNPSIKVLALAFIGFLGVILVLAGFDIEIDKGYLYFSMLFASIVEILNIKLRPKD